MHNDAIAAPRPPLPAHGQHRNLAAQAYEALATMVRERELKPGDAVVEQHVAEMLGVSRTPLREAMQRLEAEGLLRKSSGRSFEVRTVDLKEYLQSLRVREILEPEAAALAAGRIDPARIAEARDFSRVLERTEPYDMVLHWRCDDLIHRLIIDRCGNDVMARTLLLLRGTTQLFEIERLADRLGPDAREHERILDALEAKDPKAARRAVAQHIRSLFRFAVQTVS